MESADADAADLLALLGDQAAPPAPAPAAPAAPSRPQSRVPTGQPQPAGAALASRGAPARAPLLPPRQKAAPSARDALEVDRLSGIRIKPTGRKLSRQDVDSLASAFKFSKLA